MAEIAVISSRKTRLEAAAKRGHKNAKAALELSNSPTRFLSTVQIGITLIGILTGIYSGENITHDLEVVLAQFPLIATYSNTIAVTIVLLLVTFFSLVLGELLPKRIGLSNPEKIAKTLALPMVFISKITAPFIWALTVCTDGLIKLLGIKPSADGKVTEEEIKSIIQEGTVTGEIQEIEHDIMQRVFSLGDRNVSSLMTHRNEVVMLDLNYTAQQSKEIVSQEVHSIYPVYSDNKNQLEGYILLKDLFVHLHNPGFKIADYLRAPNFIPENFSAYKALELFKNTGTHHGIVIDEYGQMQGIITMNDLLTALVGNVDEFYKDDYQLQQREDGSWLIDGDYPFYDFLHRFDLDDLQIQYSFHTLGGLIIEELNNIPTEGTVLHWQNLTLEVLDMDGARIDKILITQTK